MATQNITITNKGYQDLETVGDITLTANSTYTISARGAGVCEVVIADTQPTNNFLGHIAKADENFGFTYTGETIWVKCDFLPTTIVIS